MKRLTHFYRAALASVCIVALSPADLMAGNQNSLEEKGMIKSVDPKAHILVVSEHKTKEHKFQWNDSTKFTRDGKAVAASSLSSNEHIQLTYQPGGNPPLIKAATLSPAGHSKAHASH